MLIAAFCLPALSAECNRGTHCLGPTVDPIGYKLSGMFVKGPFLNSVPSVKAGRRSLLGNELWHHFVLVPTVKWLGEGFAGKDGRR